MKKILISVSTIALVAAVTFAATSAYFSDTETSAGNTFAAGSLDLQLGQSQPLPFNVSGILPGQSDTGKVTLTNGGGISGVLAIKWINFVQDENGCTEPEISAGDPCDAGDLGLGLKMAMYADMNRNGAYDSGDIELAYNGQVLPYPGPGPAGQLHYASPTAMLAPWNNITTMAGDASLDIVVNWQLPSEWDYPKTQAVMMTDTLGFDVEFSLEQVH